MKNKIVSDQDQEKNWEILKNHKQSQKSWQALISLDLGREVLDLYMAIETKSRNLDLEQDFSIFETKILKVLTFSRLSTVETGSLPVLRLRVSIDTWLRQIETPRLIFNT